MNETLEIYKEARKAGMQIALILFGCLVIVSALFGYFIYKSYEITPTTATITQTQDGEYNSQELTNASKSNS